jgi:serine/threonine protein kinase
MIKEDDVFKGSFIAEGSYGKIYDISTENSKLALKRNLSETETSFINAVRELNMLYTLRNHPHIVKLENVIFNTMLDNQNFSPLKDDDRKLQRDDYVHFVFPKANSDLHDYIYDHVHDQFKNTKKIMVDILLGLEYMHQHHIIHRDIKPGNILLYNDAAKICDFGFAKPYTHQGIQTPGVITVCYRAPEIVLSDPHYDYKVDVWSLGCLFYELVARKTLLTETKDEDLKLFKNIMLNIPTPLTLEQFKTHVVLNPYKKFKIKNFNHNIKKKSLIQQLELSTKQLNQFTKNCGDIHDFCDLLNKMLLFNPHQRFDTTQCLDHVFFKNNKEYINKVRRDYQINIKQTPLLYVNCQERQWMAKTVMCLYENKTRLEWYNPRCLFQAVDMFSRYLYVMEANKNSIHDEFHTNLLFMACIYITIKYFSSIHYPIPFHDIVDEQYLTDDCLKMVEQFEGGLIKNCFAFEIYHETLYEAADDQLTEEDIKNLLYMFTHNTHLCHQLPFDVYQHYKHLADKSFEQLLLPL